MANVPVPWNSFGKSLRLSDGQRPRPIPVYELGQLDALLGMCPN